MRRLLIPLCALLLAGCITPSSGMDSFVGKDKEELHRKWGSPDINRPDGKGGEMWIYDKTDSYYHKTRIFYINKEGRVYRWEWKGL